MHNGKAAWFQRSDANWFVADSGTTDSGTTVGGGAAGGKDLRCPQPRCSPAHRQDKGLIRRCTISPKHDPKVDPSTCIRCTFYVGQSRGSAAIKEIICSETRKRHVVSGTLKDMTWQAWLRERKAIRYLLDAQRLQD